MSKRNHPPGCDTETIASRCRLARQAKRWTQDELAKQAHTTQAQIQKIENGKSLRPRNLERIAHLLGVSPAWLMFGRSEVDDEAMQIARMWSRLKEPHRSILRSIISREAHEPKKEAPYDGALQEIRP